MSKWIYLGNDVFTCIDSDDFDKFGNQLWCVRSSNKKCQYAAKRFVKGEECNLHRLIMNAPPELEVDHKNHERFDNRKSNLRFCLRNGNAQNRVRRGVYFRNRRGGYWEVKLQGKHVAQFKIEHEAVEKYKQLSLALYGEFSAFSEHEPMPVITQQEKDEAIAHWHKVKIQSEKNRIEKCIAARRSKK